ncbi:hypothetical protein [Actinacidiphila bryophytorum]|jgi:hypothetical protein|uniref:Uncharacterized protein n=1 Tax=Actinacidiphila bryophytorum TaxID=1436133 RepID=A0A9W4E0H2_9ACTN|nr:hypothetical protein [Actinacidiphila bryophytorum]MBM9435506.1 hypothetical protein [Actinacidiphila bryophytorum]MBN6544264.1 hypothetical protein [Actinacidiphila bryophytorum]UWE12002.1 hypothetical protein NYE86_27105 [Actinacidiphila bryophytorum]CAG7608950.1 conserved hypothetical protein [Actinacidiphila bryophytorum]
MKTTLMFRQMIANPRRTTLAHLKDATELGAAPAAGAQTAARELPQTTANPRRTVLNELPKAPVTR